MASARLMTAMAAGHVVLTKAPRVSGEVHLVFYPLMDRQTGRTVQPQSISIGSRPIEPLRRTDVTAENLRASNIEALLQRGVVQLL